MSASPSPLLEGQANSSPPSMGSDRSFGVVFAIVFCLIGVWPLKSGQEPKTWALGASAAFLSLALLAPRLLRLLNLVWFKFGIALHRLVTPVVMAAMFYLVLTPVGLLMRASGKDPMRMKKSPSALTYWIRHDDPGPTGQSMKNQF